MTDTRNTKRPVDMTADQRTKLLGAAIHLRGHGNGKIVGWTGHAVPWPTIRLDRDPPYFGLLLCDDADSLRAAMVMTGIKVVS